MQCLRSMALVGCLFGITISAQTKTDFSGHWVAAEPSGAAGHELRITQDAETLKLEQPRLWSQQSTDTFGRVRGPAAGERESTIYRIDGRPITSRSGDDARQVRSTLSWKDGQLQLTDVYAETGVRFQRILTLDGKGRLVLEQRLPVVSGDAPAASSAEMARPRRIVFERLP
jgi:hypothetical protein